MTETAVTYIASKMPEIAKAIRFVRFINVHC